MLRDRIGQLVPPFLPHRLCHRVRSPFRVIWAATLVALPGCEARLSAVHPAGPAAADIATLWWAMLLGATAIFLFVMALVLFAFRSAPAQTSAAGEARDEKVWIAGLGLGFPFAVLSALLAYGLAVGERLFPRPGPEVVTVRAEGRQWAWSFAYADAPGRVTEGILHIPAGRPVDVQITTADVIHSFWVPRLAGKLDAIPGHVNVLRIEAWRPGDYAGLGAEYNGRGYAGHAFTVRAHDAGGWAAFLAENRP